jgi:hypothetical protein
MSDRVWRARGVEVWERPSALTRLQRAIAARGGRSAVLAVLDPILAVGAICVFTLGLVGGSLWLLDVLWPVTPLIR